MSPRPINSRKTSLVDDLKHFKLPSAIIKQISHSGIQQLRFIQKQALNQGLLAGNSFLVISPSGSGKTFIGELSALNQIFKHHRKALYLVPLRALANEKYFTFNQQYGKLGLKSLLVVGDQDVYPEELQEADLYIMTYEKFDAFLRKEPHSEWIKFIDTIIVDEVHILGDSHRGPRLENLIIRLYHLHISKQMIYLSATIGNPDLIGSWLDSLESKFHKSRLQIITYDKRPIPLKYKILVTRQKMDVIAKIAQKTVQEKGQVLIFTNSRGKTEALAQQLTKCNLLSYQEFSGKLKTNKWVSSLATLLNLPLNEFNSEFLSQLESGIMYYHAGLNMAERKLIEEAFIQEKVLVLFTTTSLSAGINLPARTVILHSTYLYHKSLSKTGNEFKAYRKYIKKPLNRNLFHQICGRAGRPGYDPIGNVYILTDTNNERMHIEEYYFTNNSPEIFVPKYDKIQSRLISNRDMLLEAILLKIYEVERFTYLELLNFIQDSLAGRLIAQEGIPVNNYLNLFESDLLSLIKTFTPDLHLQLLKQAKINLSILNFRPTKEIKGQIHIILSKENYPNISNNIWDQFYKNISPINIYKDFEDNVEINANFEYSLAHPESWDDRLKDSPNASIIYQTSKPFKTRYYFSFLQSCILYALKYHHSSDSRTNAQYNQFFYNIIYPPSIIHTLFEYKLINYSDAAKQEISCTIPGEIALKCYIVPSLAQKFNLLAMKFLQKRTLPTLTEILHEILLEMNNHSQNIPVNAIELALGWIQEKPLSIIQLSQSSSKETVPLANSDLARFFDQFARNIKFFRDFMNEQAKINLFQFFNDLYLRMKFGIREDLLIWAKMFRNIEIRPFRALANKKINTTQNFLKTHTGELAKLLRMSSSEISHLKDIVKHFHP